MAWTVQSELSGGCLREFIYSQKCSKTTNKLLAVKYYICFKILSNNTREFILTLGMNMSMQAVDIFPDHLQTVN